MKWESTAGGFDHADKLVTLASSMGFEVGVAAFPDGHPASMGNFEQDIKVLLEKEDAGQVLLLPNSSLMLRVIST